MSDNHYPPLVEANLLLAVRLANTNPLYLSDPECPYSEKVKRILKPETEEADIQADKNGMPTTDNMLNEINTLYQDLQEYGRNAEKTTDKSTYFRLATGLLSDLVDLKAQCSKLKQHESFVSAVMGIMEDVLDADQRSEFQTRLEKFNDTGSI